MTMPNVLYNGPGNWPDADKLMANYDYLENLAKSYTSFRNRIINGDMRIDQRNEGASVTVNSTTPVFCVDRWSGEGQATDGIFTLQRSTTSPVGFGYSLKAAVTTADASIGTIQTYLIRQKVEGYNLSDFGLGTALGKSMTISFWVRCSLTGDFGGAILSASGSRGRTFRYSISTANTFEYKSITIPCDTTGTWLIDNGIGIHLVFSLGVGSSLLQSDSYWGGAAYSPPGMVNLIGTNAATLYISGVQLELGTVSTPFEFRYISQELQLCQRYYAKSYPNGVTPGTATMAGIFGASGNGSGNGESWSVRFPTTMRATPTVTLYSPATGASGYIRNITGASDVSANPTAGGTISDSGFANVGIWLSASTIYALQYSANAEI